ncbi:MAG: restriction endonuclease subunit S [Thermoplasmata archaeon]
MDKKVTQWENPKDSTDSSFSQNRFEDTKNRRIPDVWEVVEFVSICKKLKSGGTPITSKKEYYNGRIPFVKIEDITSAGKYLIETKTYITEEGLKNSNAWLVPKDSVLLAIYGSIGAVSINKTELATNQAILGIILNQEKAINEFIYYMLLFLKDTLLRQAKHTTQANLTGEIIKKLKIPLPPLPEQKAIAKVLSTVDEAIQKCNELIAKTERLKQGLMRELLTKGIGHKEFKDTEIGRIPKEWEVVRLGDENIAEIRGNKIVSGFENVAFIPMELIPDSDIFVKYELRAMGDVKSFVYCERDDLLLAKITPSLENGKQGIVPDEVPNGFALATTEVFPISCKGIDKLFLFYILKFPKFRNKIIASMIGTTGRQRASKESVENLLIPLPPLPEQQKIAEILSTIDKKLELERKRKEKLERIKKGLMNDLLTGKRRIPKEMWEKIGGE